jgi:hypothetical protein
MQGVNEKSGKHSNYKIRKISIICSSQKGCVDETAEDDLAYVIYTNDKCEGYGLSSPVFAQSSKKVKCLNRKCGTKLNVFMTSTGSVKVTHLVGGSYTVVSFIDMNHNESLDLGEPYFCKESIAISAKESLKQIYIEMNVNY